MSKSRDEREKPNPKGALNHSKNQHSVDDELAFVQKIRQDKKKPKSDNKNPTGRLAAPKPKPKGQKGIGIGFFEPIAFNDEEKKNIDNIFIPDDSEKYVAPGYLVNA